MKYNIITECLKGREFLITKFYATNMNEKTFNNVKERLEKGLIKNEERTLRFCDFNETDFTWWDKINTYITARKSTINKDLILLNFKHCYFDIDYWGNVTRY